MMVLARRMILRKPVYKKQLSLMIHNSCANGLQAQLMVIINVNIEKLQPLFE